ncbi:Uncharacterised protein [Mycobacteroides abscessus]|nr:Uncharacterised protein [Mycobacteroides abscessus]
MANFRPLGSDTVADRLEPAPRSAIWSAPSSGTLGHELPKSATSWHVPTWYRRPASTKKISPLPGLRTRRPSSPADVYRLRVSAPTVAIGPRGS